MTVFAVIYGNYFPREIDSHWSTRELAEKRCERLHDGTWEVEEQHVFDSPEDLDRLEKE